MDGSGAITVDEVVRCAQVRISAAWAGQWASRVAGQPGIAGQQAAVAANAQFVPVWVGAAFESQGARAVAPATAAAPMPPRLRRHAQASASTPPRRPAQPT